MFLSSKGKVIDTYNCPQDLFDQLNQYDRNTLFCFVSHLSHTIDGIEMARQLYQAGYDQLYLISGKHFHADELPPYLVCIDKMDIDRIEKLLLGTS